jgi:hypothetical protein
MHVSPHGAKVGEEKDLVERLLARRRAWTAVRVLAAAAHREKNDSNPVSEVPSNDLIVRALFQAVGEEPGPGELDNMATYALGQLFDHLVDHGADDTLMARLEFVYFRLLEYTRQPAALSNALATKPAMFVELVTLAYTGRDAKVPKRSDSEQQLARQASWVLHSWTGFPGQAKDGTLNSAVLDEWLRDARLALSETGHTDIGDELIGQSFAYAPKDDDGIWPPEPVRLAVERIGSNELENGLVIGRFNSRGVTTRGAYEGGDQERKLAAQYRAWARSVMSSAPRTARALTSLAEDYERDAAREDIRAEADADSD